MEKNKSSNSVKVSKLSPRGRKTVHDFRHNNGSGEATGCRTPKEQRHKMKLRLRKMVTVDDESSQSSTSASEDCSDDETDNTSKKVDDDAGVCDAAIVMKNNASDYFNNQGKSSLTSNKTLACLRQDLQEMDLQEKMSEMTPKHEGSLKRLSENYMIKYHKWITYLKNGFNILFYGIGSKMSVLQQFRESLMTNYTVLEVKGFQANANINMVLQTIMEFLNKTDYSSKLEDQLKLIHRKFRKSRHGELCLLVHNIDGRGFRNEKAQEVLCNLAKSPSIHIVASIDHVRTPLLWDTGKLASFNWIWEDITTFLVYNEETADDNSLFVKRTGSLGLSSATQVFHSLTPNAKGIFLLLAKQQLDKMENNNNYTGMPFHECYSLCREAFLVNSQLTLNTQLIEFKDHKLLKVKKGSDGVEYLLITLDTHSLSAFIETHT
ncbi:Origin recognition complex subunit 2 [Chamberlinius hualienensis]